MDCSWVINLLGALFGGICTLAGAFFAFRKEQKSQEKHAASMLYFDLLSVEGYLKNERGAVNIRYSSEWQNMISNCKFLSSNEVMKIYKIYDWIYNYNYHYQLKEKDGPVCKESIFEYEELKRFMFYYENNHIDMKKRTDEYQKIMELLKEKSNR